MAGRIEHHADAALVTVRRLVRSDGSAGGNSVRDGSFQVLDQDLEVQHFGLLVKLLGPCRRAVPLLRLEVEPNAAVGIACLHPALAASAATVVREEAYGANLGHVVMLDPDGNEFCVA